MAEQWRRKRNMILRSSSSTIGGDPMEQNPLSRHQYGLMVPIPDKAVILVVDDSEDDLAIVRAAIRKAGLPNRLVEIRDGSEVANYFQGHGKFSDRKNYPPA